MLPANQQKNKFIREKKMISEFLKKNLNEFNYGNFIVKKIHASLILMVLAGFLFYATEFKTILFLEIIFSLIFFHTLLIEAKKKFQKDFKYFLTLYGLFYLVVQAMWLNNFIVPKENRMDAGFFLIFILIAIAVGFSLLLKKKTVKAKVLSSNGKITVIETEFDLKSFTKGGKHIIKTKEKFNEGQEIKIKINKNFFGKKIQVIR